jgi:hypothetical protein
VPAVIETPEGDFIGIRQNALSHSYDHAADGALGGSFVKKSSRLSLFDVNRIIKQYLILKNTYNYLIGVFCFFFVKNYFYETYNLLFNRFYFFFIFFNLLLCQKIIF